MLPLLCFVLTVAIYAAAKKLYLAVPKVVLTPLLTVPIAVIGIVACFHIPFEAYQAGTKWISGMIGPATVALAVPLHKNFGILKRHALTIGAGVGSGALAAIVTSAWLSERLHLTPEITDSLAPRSATTPIAVAVSGHIGGVPSMTAVFVLLTGLSGMLLGPLVVRLLRITDEIARGVLMGTSSHNAGTSKAFEFGSVSGTIASIAMVLTAFITLCAAPLLVRWMF